MLEQPESESEPELQRCSRVLTQRGSFDDGLPATLQDSTRRRRFRSAFPPSRLRPKCTSSNPNELDDPADHLSPPPPQAIRRILPAVASCRHPPADLDEPAGARPFLCPRVAVARALFIVAIVPRVSTRADLLGRPLSWAHGRPLCLPARPRVRHHLKTAAAAAAVLPAAVLGDPAPAAAAAAPPPSTTPTVPDQAPRRCRRRVVVKPRRPHLERLLSMSSGEQPHR